VQGWGQETTVPPPATTPAPATPAAGKGTVGTGQTETIRDVPLALNTEQSVPPDFWEA
jgi:hypothetical protein